MQPFKMDFHVHSDYSSDSQTPMQEMIEKAISLGVTHLAFTDHVDFEYDGNTETSTGTIDWDFDKDHYFNTVQQFKTKYGHTIKLHHAVELGLQEKVAKQNHELCQNYDFDFVLASLHMLHGEDLMQSQVFKSTPYKSAIREYFASYYNNILHFDSYDTLGHLDLYLRYFKDSKSVSFTTYSDYVETLLKRVIETGKGIEVNAGGYRYGLGHNNPTEPFLKLYRSLGGEIITLGSDAHSPNYVADQYDVNVEMLKAIGFKYVTTFEKRKPIFHKL